jgi:VanZ family protein
LRRRWLEFGPGVSWAVLGLYVALILYLASQPRTDPLATIRYSDKLLHGAEYGMLGFLGQRAARLSWPQTKRGAMWRRLALAFCAGLCVAALDELVQTRVPGRDASVLDVCADAVGLAIGAALNLKASLLEGAGLAEMEEPR